MRTLNWQVIGRARYTRGQGGGAMVARYTALLPEATGWWRCGTTRQAAIVPGEWFPYLGMSRSICPPTKNWSLPPISSGTGRRRYPVHHWRSEMFERACSFAPDPLTMDESSGAAVTCRPERYEVVMASEGDAYIKSIAVSGARLFGRTLDFPSSGRVEMNVTLATGLATFRGAVKQEEKAVGGAMVLLLPDDLASNTALARRDQSDSDGTFLLRNVVPGNYTLLALPPGSENVEYLRPQVIAPYLASGRRVAIQPNGRYQALASLSLNDNTIQEPPSSAGTHSRAAP